MRLNRNIELVLALALAPQVAAQITFEIVGGFSCTLQPGWNLVANALRPPDNSIPTVFDSMPTGTAVSKYSQGHFRTTTFDGVSWDDPEMTLAPGEGLFVLNPTAQSFLVTMFGSLTEGRLTNAIPAGYSLTGSLLPGEAPITTDLGLRLAPFDNLYRWDNNHFNVYTVMPDGGWYPDEPTLRLGEGFFVNASQPTNWVIEFYTTKEDGGNGLGHPAGGLTHDARGLYAGQAGRAAQGIAEQGTLNFANGAAGVCAPVTVATTGQPAHGSHWRADLWLVSGGEPVARLGASVDLATPAPGYFFGGSVAVPGHDLQQTAEVVVRVYHTNGAMQGFSNPVRVVLGGERYPPANLVGLEAWSVNSIDNALRIRLEGSEVTVSWPKELWGYVLESSQSLSQSNWASVAQPAQLVGERWLVTIPPTSQGMYFRLRLSP